MNCLDAIISIAQRQLKIITSQPEVTALYTPDFGWENHRFASPMFRLAHVEIFRQPSFGVIHCCVFPHASDPAPIYGFDVIASQTKVTGVFMDLSPTVSTVEPFLKIQLGKERIRPEWGDIFSPHWLACRPTSEELDIIGNEAVRLLTDYFLLLGEQGPTDKIIAAQNHYCKQQQKNEHTRKALTNLIGADRTEEFMTEILFPCIEN